MITFTNKIYKSFSKSKVMKIKRLKNQSNIERNEQLHQILRD